MSTAPVALVDAGGANFASVRHALQRLGADVRIARDAGELRGARCIVLPGVGAAAPALALLRDRGFDAALPVVDVPLLGICLGMQLLFEHCEEGDVAALGLLPGRVEALSAGLCARIPHMGWNTVWPTRPSPLFRDMVQGEAMYFVHGFGVVDGNAAQVARCVHGRAFAAAVQHGHVFGVQFHPERSATAGARLLANFLQVPAP